MSTYVFISRYGLDDNFRGPEDEGIPDKYLKALTAISVNIPEGRYGTRYNERHSTIFELIQLLCTKCLICSKCFILFFFVFTILDQVVSYQWTARTMLYFMKKHYFVNQSIPIIAHGHLKCFLLKLNLSQL